MKSFPLSLILLSIFSYSSATFSKTIVLSDIDDTIKKANTMGGVGGLYHFFKKKPFEETRDLFNEIKNFNEDRGEQVSFYYVSAAPSFSFDGEEWIKKNRFPSGRVVLKTRENGGATYDYKYRTMKAIIEDEMKKNENVNVIFFGDNSQFDAKVYYDLNEALNLQAKIYIRDVSTEATFFDSTLPVVRLPKVEYFFSERELVDDLYFSFMSPTLIDLINRSYSKKELVPLYTLETMVDRLKERCQAKLIPEALENNCRVEAKKEASKYWSDYYSRFN